MRTKILILSAAALAAGFLSSQAQVFSANVVGYVNVKAFNGFNPQSAVLKVGSGSPFNAATNVIPNIGGAYNGAVGILIFNPLSNKYFQEVYMDDSKSTGYAFIDDTTAPTPILPIGAGFVLDNQTGAPFTNTIVGEVQGWSSVTLTFSNRITIPDGFSTAASPLPIAVTLGSSPNGLPNVAGNLNGLRVDLLPVGSGVNTTVYYDDGSGTGFVGNDQVTPVAAPVIPVGGSVLFFNDGSTPFGHTGIPWTQILP